MKMMKGALALLALLVYSVPASANHQAAGFASIQDTTCTIGVGQTCTFGPFTLPDETLVSATSVLWFRADGVGISNLKIEVRVNGTIVLTVPGIDSFGIDNVMRDLHEIVGAGILIAGPGNIVEITGTGGTGRVGFADVVLQYRLNTVP